MAKSVGTGRGLRRWFCLYCTRPISSPSTSYSGAMTILPLPSHFYFTYVHPLVVSGRCQEGTIEKDVYVLGSISGRSGILKGSERFSCECTPVFGQINRVDSMEPQKR